MDKDFEITQKFRNNSLIFCVSASNNYIYISRVESLLMMDLNFNPIKSSRELDKSYDHMSPRSIYFYKNYLYVCDLYNRSVEKWSEDLILMHTFAIDYSPLRIVINEKNSVCCVLTQNLYNCEDYFLFYNVNNFELIRRFVRDPSEVICSISNLFLKYSWNYSAIYFYNQIGDEIGSFTTDFFKEIGDFDLLSLLVFDDNLLVVFESRLKIWKYSLNLN